MNDFWLKFGCFLTGYNYSLVRNSSEASAKAVKKFISAIIIVSFLWGFIGYAFTQRYLHGNLWLSILGASVMVLMVIQIERQIILTVGKKSTAKIFRIIIGLVMAILGSVILDQIIFKDDVEKHKISNIQEEVDRLLPHKTRELDNQIRQLDSTILAKENERIAVIQEVTQNPMISIPFRSVTHERDSTGKMVLKSSTMTTQSLGNPKADMIPQLDTQIASLREQKIEKEKSKITIRQDLEDELTSKTGFLDELAVLFNILFGNGIAFFIWVMLFLFFLAIELFVLVNKFMDAENDYDKTVLHQMETRIRMLAELSGKNLNP